MSTRANETLGFAFPFPFKDFVDAFPAAFAAGFSAGFSFGLSAAFFT